MKNFIATLDGMSLSPSSRELESAVDQLKTFSYELDNFRAEERMRMLLDLAVDRSLGRELKEALGEFQELAKEGQPSLEDLNDFLDLLEQLLEEVLW